MTVSKEMVRLRLYALSLAGDMAGLVCAFLAANWFVLGALWGNRASRTASSCSR